MKKSIYEKTLMLPNEAIYQKAKKRYRSKNDHDLVIELENEIDYYRNKIQNIENSDSNDNLIWFKLNPNTNSEELYKFISYYLPFREVVNLHHLLSNNFRENYIDEIHKHKDEKLYDAINKFRR